MSSSTISFSDRPRRLRYTLSAVRQFKAAANMPLWKVRTPDENGLMHLLDSEMMTRVVWAGLLHEEPKLAFEGAEELLQDYLDSNGERAFSDIYEALAEAFNESGLFGTKVDAKKGKKDKKDKKAVEGAEAVPKG